MMLNREKILEVLTFWRTRVTAEYLGKILGTSRQTAQSGVINDFNRKFPNQLLNERRRHGLSEGRTLDEPVFGDPEIGSLFHLLVAMQEFGTRKPDDSGAGRETILGFPAEEVCMPELEDVNPLRHVTAAAAHRRAMIGTYAFKKRGTARVRFSPYAMVRTPYRIHFRGFLEIYTADGDLTPHGYRDLVPARFVEIEDETGHATLPGRDEEWRADETLRFRLNPDLPAAVRTTFAQEYGLAASDDDVYEMTVTSRKAYAHYYRKEVFARTWGENRIPVWNEYETHP